MAIADELIAILGYRIEGEDQVRRYKQSLDGVGNSINNLAKWVAGLYVGQRIGRFFGGLAQSVVQTSATFEGFEAALTTIEGTSEKARESLSWISKFAATTPYEVEGITNAFIKLKAYGVDPIANDTLRILGDTASAMNKPLNQAVEAFADAATFQFERLKEFGITSAQKGDQVTFSWTKNGENLTKVVKKNAEDIRTFLLENFGSRFAGAMDKQSKTFNGMMSNLADRWTDFKKRIGDAGFFDNVKDKLQTVLDTLDRLDKEGRLDEWATSLSTSFSWVADGLWVFVERTATNLKFLGEHFDKLSTPLLILLSGLAFMVMQAFPLVTVFIALGLVIDDFLAYLQGSESIIGDFIEWFKGLTGVSDTVAQALAALGVTVGLLLMRAFLIAPVAILGKFGWLLFQGANAAVSLFALGMRGLQWAVVAGFRLAALAISAGAAALAPIMTAALAGLNAAVAAGMSAALFLLTNPIGWAILIAGAGAGLIWYFWEDVEEAFTKLGTKAVELFNSLKEWFASVDWSGVGTQIMTAIWEDMKAIGEAIKEWFASLFSLPDWAKDLLGSGGTAGPAPEGSTLNPKAEAPTPKETTNLTNDAWDAKLELQRQEWAKMQQNLMTHIDRQGAERSSEAVVNDNRQDNRQFPMTVHTEVNQTITQPSNAPGAVGQATGQAVERAVAGTRSQIEQEPAF